MSKCIYCKKNDIVTSYGDTTDFCSICFSVINSNSIRTSDIGFFSIVGIDLNNFLKTDVEESTKHFPGVLLNAFEIRELGSFFQILGIQFSVEEFADKTPHYLKNKYGDFEGNENISVRTDNFGTQKIIIEDDYWDAIYLMPIELVKVIRESAYKYHTVNKLDDNVSDNDSMLLKKLHFNGGVREVIENILDLVTYSQKHNLDMYLTQKVHWDFHNG